MELAQDKIELIGRLVKGDKKFSGNEDLFEDFLNEACKRSFLIVKSVTNPISLEAYLKKIVTTSIVVVLKDLGRVRRTQEGFVATKEVSLDDTSVNVASSEVVTPISDVVELPRHSVSYDIIDLSDTPEEIVIKKELLQTVADTICVEHSKDVSKQFMQIYECRYLKGMKQADIAEELNISQSEVSKRLFELMDAVKKSFE